MIVFLVIGYFIYRHLFPRPSAAIRIQNLGTGKYLVLQTGGGFTNYVSADGDPTDPTSLWRITAVTDGLLTLTNASTGNSLDYTSATPGSVVFCDSNGGTDNKLFLELNGGSGTVFFQSIQSPVLYLLADVGSVTFPSLDNALYLGNLANPLSPGVGALYRTIPAS